jgi:hypothetical protein
MMVNILARILGLDEMEQKESKPKRKSRLDKKRREYMNIRKNRVPREDKELAEDENE